VTDLAMSLPSDRSTFTSFVVTAALVLLGAVAFFHHLDVSLLEGSEGLYAHIAREMIERDEWMHLSYLGEPYRNKPPLFFWLLAGSTTLLGENEVALRLPGAVFSLGTMALTYWLGSTMFSRRAGLWAALVVATTHVSLWYGRRVLFDSGVTFGITLALGGWMMAERQRTTSGWYIVSFLGMAFATTLKGLHGFLLPVLVIIAMVLIQRTDRPFKQPAFWVGAALSVGLMVFHYSQLGTDVADNVLGRKLLTRATVESYQLGHPLYWYLGIMWFDFFPWSLLLPVGVARLAAARPLRQHPNELFVLLWLTCFLVGLSVAATKREPYLLSMVPARVLWSATLSPRCLTASWRRTGAGQVHFGSHSV
jgi:4-amino-4-deoxy-L-arabinose transferase-like glycosyltransferase